MGALGAIALAVVLFFSNASYAEEDKSYEGIEVKGIHFIHTDKKPFTNRSMRDKMSTRIGTPFVHQAFDDDIAALRKRYQTADYLQVQIDPDLQLDATGQLKITLTIASGKKINALVKDIHFVHLGEKHFTNRQLRATMKTQEEAPFERRFFRGDLSSIENLYRGEGYMEVDIVRQNLALLKNLNRLYRGEALESSDKLKLTRDGFDLTIEINPGPRWSLAQVRLELEGSFDQAELLGQLGFAAGSPFLYREILEGERILQSYLLQAGYAQAQVSNQVALDPDNANATITYRVTPGPRLYFGPINFTGAPDNKTLHSRESLLRRYVTIKPGTVYNPEAMRSTRAELASTGLFRSVTVRRPALAPAIRSNP